MPIFMNYGTINGETGSFTYQNNIRPQLGLKGIQFGQLQTVSINWGDQPNSILIGLLLPAVRKTPALTGDALTQAEQLASQLRPYMATTGKLSVAGLTSAAMLNFCHAAGLPTSMVQLNGGINITQWGGPTMIAAAGITY